MDDWKLKTTPVVRIEWPNRTFVHATLYIFFSSNFVCASIYFHGREPEMMLGLGSELGLGLRLGTAV